MSQLLTILLFTVKRRSLQLWAQGTALEKSSAQDTEAANITTEPEAAAQAAVAGQATCQAAPAD